MAEGMHWKTSLFEELSSEDGPVTAQRADAALCETARKLPPAVRLGTSSWNFPGWRGLVYGPSSGTKRLASEGLAAYARHPLFKTVGLDRNFYRPLSVSDYAAFADQTPADFRFLVKAPSETTDPCRRGKNGRPLGDNHHFLSTDLALEHFLRPVSMGLGERAGPLVFQFSPFARERLRSEAARREAVQRILDFLRRIRAADLREHLLCAEFRNPELLTPRMLDGLRELSVRPVLGIHPSMPPVVRQILAIKYYETGTRSTEPWGAWRFSGPLVVRWSLAASEDFNRARLAWAPYDRIVSPDAVTRSLIANLVVRAAESGAGSFAVANNKAEGCAPLTMRRMAESIVLTEAQRREARERAAREEETLKRRQSEARALQKELARKA